MKLFKKYVQSSDSEYKSFYKPFKVKGITKLIQKKLSDFLIENGYENIIVDDGNFEVYGTKKDHEITYILVKENDGTCRIYLSVYTPKSRFKARKILRILFEETRLGLQDILTHNVEVEGQ